MRKILEDQKTRGRLFWHIGGKRTATLVVKIRVVGYTRLRRALVLAFEADVEMHR